MAEQVSNDGLYKALGLFTQGVKDYALSTALTQANEQVQQIKLAGIDGAKQRQALGGVAQSLVSQMLGAGVPATTAQLAGENLVPKLPATADGAVLQGIYTGNQDLVNAGLGAQDAAGRRNLQKIQEEEAFKLKLQQSLFKQQTDLQDKRLEAQESRASKSANQKSGVALESNALVAQRSLKDLEETVIRVGNTESTSPLSIFSDKKAAATLSQAGLDFAIAYAKIVDPNSVAREGEVETAKKYAIPMGADISNDVTLAAISRMKADIAQRLADNKRLTGQTPNDTIGINPEATGLRRFLIRTQ